MSLKLAFLILIFALMTGLAANSAHYRIVPHRIQPMDKVFRDCYRHLCIIICHCTDRFIVGISQLRGSKDFRVRHLTKSAYPKDRGLGLWSFVEFHNKNICSVTVRCPSVLVHY